MGDIRIRLLGNIQTGQREVVIEYDADPSLTRLEHEQRHRQLVESLVLQGTISRDEAAHVVYRAGEPPQDAAVSEGQPG